MQTIVEHVNITVPDIERTLTFLKIVAPDFNVRKEGTPENGSRWVHFGNTDFYIAIEEPRPGSTPKDPLQSYVNYGKNHIGLVVEDLDKIANELDKLGYTRGIATPEEKFRKRLYYKDHDNFEWELVEYFSDKAEEKNLYE